MRFSFTDEQLALRDGAREVLEGTCSPADVRAIFDSGDVTAGRSAERWRALDELGATSLLASDASGGLGFSDVELVGVIEEAGKVVLPEPLGVHAGVAIPVLSLGEPTACELLASLIENGDVVSVGGVDVALSGPVVTWFEGRAVAERVPSVHRATRFLLASANEDGVVVSLVDSADCEITPTPSLDPTRDLGTVSWMPTPENMFANGAEAIVVIDEIASRLALYAAAEIVGLVDAMLTMTAAYTMDRQQFGAAIGSFQAVKHLLADVRVGLEFARPAVYRAAWSMASDDDTKHHDAALAKALASQLALDAAATCLQVHGGIGYTWENDLQFAMKRCWALARTAGDAATQRARAMSMGLELS